MRGDFTRDSFDAANRFRRVLLQQGRVQLDADFNEQSAILLRQGEILTTALLGRFGGPRNIVDDAGLCVPNNGFLIQDADDSFKIRAGRYFVDGILCENFDDELKFSAQPDFPPIPEDDPPTAGSFLVYLEVFERSLSAVEDDSISEPALEGLDTAARSRVIWQVKVVVPQTTEPPLPMMSPISDLAWNAWLRFLDPPGRGMLKARTNSGVVNDGNPCIVPIASAFRGEDNQLYRVEIHDGSPVNGEAGGATFKWSRENGSVLFPIESLAGNTATVTALGRDRRFGLKPGDWVEVTDDHRELRRENVLPLFQVESIVRDQRLVVLAERNDASLPEYDVNDPRHPLLRRWDGGDAKLVSEAPGSWAPLENGIEIQFAKQVSPAYRPGDYWLIPARVALGDIIWPREEDDPKALPPRGIIRHFAPLAVGNADGFTDLRRLFDPLGLAPPTAVVAPTAGRPAPRTRTR